MIEVANAKAIETSSGLNAQQANIRNAEIIQTSTDWGDGIRASNRESTGNSICVLVAGDAASRTAIIVLTLKNINDIH